MNVPTREVFGNIQPWMQVLFYALILLSIVVLIARVVRRATIWRKTAVGWDKINWSIALRRLLTYALGQKRVFRRSIGALAHLLIYSGFVILTIGTTLLFISHAGPVNFHKGWYYLIYELVMEGFGVAFCLGCVLAILRRMFWRPASLGHNRGDWLLLATMLAIGLSGFLLEALRLKYSAPEPNHARWSIVAWAINESLLQSTSIQTAKGLHLAIWWAHAVLVCGFIACIPVTRLLHIVTGPLHIALKPERTKGALQPVSLETVEATGRIGVDTIQHFNGQQLLSLDACMECGRCEDACPAWASGKPLSPKAVVLDLRKAMSRMGSAGKSGDSNSEPSLHGETIRAETLWACTMCQACVQECPVLIGHVDIIADMRRHLVAEGAITGPPANALRNVGMQANPFGLSNADRTAWCEGMNIPTVQSNPDFEYLLWIGCAAAFDPRSRRIARATAELLQAAGVNFAILGTMESCTGDPARRLGDEFLFQELAGRNIGTLKSHRVRKVITPCPHCLHTIRNEYPQFGGHYEVFHHSQFLAQLMDEGKLKSGPPRQQSLTFHDPCYLARVNNETAAPRRVLGQDRNESSASAFREMPRHGDRTFCCGAGGGRIWFEEAPDQRVSVQRAQEALSTGAKTLATACPFCLTMMTDGMASVEGGSEVEVIDISEVLLRNQRDSLAPLDAV